MQQPDDSAGHATIVGIPLAPALVSRRHAGILTLFMVGSLALVGAYRLDPEGALARRLAESAAGTWPTRSVNFEGATEIRAGDPVLLPDAEGFAVVGRVLESRMTDGRATLRVEFDPGTLRTLHADATLESRAPGSNLGWALGELLPPETRVQLERDLTAAFARERDALAHELEPALREHLSSLARAVVGALPAAAAADHDTLASVWLRVSADGGGLKPAFEARVWPLVESEIGTAGASIADEVVRQIGFGNLVSAIYARARDAVGVGSETAFKTEVAKLLQEKAMPVVRSRTPDLAAAVVRAARRAWDDPELRDAVAGAAARLGDDTEIRKVAAQLSGKVAEDSHVKAEIDALIADPRLRSAADRLARAAEPVFESAVQSALLRDDGQGMNRRLVRVLRNVLLWKDRRHLLLDPGTAGLPPTGALRGLAGR